MNSSLFGLNLKMIKRIINFLHTPTWLLILLAIVLILRIPSFFEPYSYGDETIYLTLGEAIRRGIPLYKGIHDNKPPLIYIMAYFAGSLFWFKAILAVWNIATIFVFWRLCRILFPKNLKTQKVATSVFAFLTTLPLLEGNIVNAEIFMIGPTILGFYLLLSQKLTKSLLFIAGILFSIATLFKIPAAFDILAIGFLWLADEKKLNKKNLRKIFLKTSYLLVGFLTPLILSFVWFDINGSLREYFVAAFLQNLGYLSSWRPTSLQQPFLVKNFPLLFRGFVVLIGLSFLFLKRNKLSKQFIFACSWLILSLFAATLSERPYPHYLIQNTGAFSIILGIMFTQESMEQAFAIIPITLTLLTAVYFKFWYYPTIPYYLRFLKYTKGAMTHEQYLTSFGKNVLRDYKIADFLLTATKREEKIFIWGESSQIYALSKRFPPIKYIAGYHIKDFSNEKEILKIFSKDPPSFIIILEEKSQLPLLEKYLNNNYALLDTIDGAQIWKLLSPKIRGLISFQLNP